MIRFIVDEVVRPIIGDFDNHIDPILWQSFHRHVLYDSPFKSANKITFWGMIIVQFYRMPAYDNRCQ